MTQDPNFYLMIGAFALICVLSVATLSLRGWRDWIALKHAELQAQQNGTEVTTPSTASRIEVADLKERVKKLEAIAAGIDI